MNDKHNFYKLSQTQKACDQERTCASFRTINPLISYFHNLGHIYIIRRGTFGFNWKYVMENFFSIYSKWRGLACLYVRVCARAGGIAGERTGTGRNECSAGGKDEKKKCSLVTFPEQKSKPLAWRGRWNIRASLTMWKLSVRSLFSRWFVEKLRDLLWWKGRCEFYTRLCLKLLTVNCSHMRNMTYV